MHRQENPQHSPDIDVVDTKRQVGRTDRSNSPVRLRAECLLLVVCRGDRLDFVSVTMRGVLCKLNVYLSQPRQTHMFVVLVCNAVTCAWASVDFSISAIC